jgi:hypothetical protein
MATHRERYLKKMGLDTKRGYSIAELSNVSGVSSAILQQVFNRGVGARVSNPQSVRLIATGKKNTSSSLAGKMSAEQWGMARVYSFLNKGKTYETTDADLARRAKY